MSLVIHGVGTAVPEHFMLQTDFVELAQVLAGPEGPKERTLKALYRRSGVGKRHSVVLERATGPLDARQSFYDTVPSPGDPGPTTAARMARYEAEAPPLGARASARALAEAGWEADDVTHLVTVSCTGFFAPGLDAALVEALELPRSVHRTHVGFMGCHGAMNGVRVASSFTSADPNARVLICAVELCSLHLAYGSNPHDLVANAIFGDGAAALAGAGPGQPGRGGDWTVAANGTSVLPDSGDAMSWRIGDHGFRMTLSPRVPDLIQARLPTWLETWLANEGLGMEEVATWAVHPGGPRILTAVEGALGLEKAANEVPRGVLAEFGNMSSATILFILQRLRAEGAPRPLVALAFGPGLAVEAVLIR
ncbi:MAG: type III polyketide synthase [Gemmatimonadota bacterium]